MRRTSELKTINNDTDAIYEIKIWGRSSNNWKNMQRQEVSVEYPALQDCKNFVWFAQTIFYCF